MIILHGYPRSRGTEVADGKATVSEYIDCPWLGFVFTFGRSQFVQVIVQQTERWTVNCYTWDMNNSAGLVIVFVQKKKVI